ncbi:hypothetical protein HPB47_006567 [Ixodes persulcatus]|uniref:Uncharacterized protein n=1 Tax=Ixodes persulcatus TaxID=34615 RepID=A0AC60P9U8_IXOPE|nr:hypothetical protein HPB47_006567 [Ixodes persulcatus]
MNNRCTRPTPTRRLVVPSPDRSTAKVTPASSGQVAFAAAYSAWSPVSTGQVWQRRALPVPVALHPVEPQGPDFATVPRRQCHDPSGTLTKGAEAPAEKRRLQPGSLIGHVPGSGDFVDLLAPGPGRGSCGRAGGDPGAVGVSVKRLPQSHKWVRRAFGVLGMNLGALGDEGPASGHQALKDSPEERTVRSGVPGTVAVEAPESQRGLLFCRQRQQAVGLQGLSRAGHQNRKGCHYSPAVVIHETTAKQAFRDSHRKNTPPAPDPLVQCAKVLNGHRLPCDAGVPIWFDEVERPFSTYRGSAQGQVSPPEFGIEDCAGYEQLKRAVPDELQLAPPEYLERFDSTSKRRDKSWTQFALQRVRLLCVDVPAEAILDTGCEIIADCLLFREDWKLLGEDGHFEGGDAASVTLRVAIVDGHGRSGHQGAAVSGCCAISKALAASRARGDFVEVLAPGPGRCSCGRAGGDPGAVGVSVKRLPQSHKWVRRAFGVLGRAPGALGDEGPASGSNGIVDEVLTGMALACEVMIMYISVGLTEIHRRPYVWITKGVGVFLRFVHLMFIITWMSAQVGHYGFVIKVVLHHGEVECWGIGAIMDNIKLMEFCFGGIVVRNIGMGLYATYYLIENVFHFGVRTLVIVTVLSILIDASFLPIMHSYQESVGLSNPDNTRTEVDSQADRTSDK